MTRVEFKSARCLAAIILVVACTPAGGASATIGAAPSASLDLNAAIVSAGLVPDGRVRINLMPDSARIRNGLLNPPVAVAVRNDSGEQFFASQLLIIMRLDDANWVPMGCSSDGVDVGSASGCDLLSGAQIILNPGQIVDERSSLPYVLDWPYGTSVAPGTYAVLVAFDTDDRYERGTAARLVVAGP